MGTVPEYLCKIDDPKPPADPDPCGSICCFSCPKLATCETPCEDIENGNTDKPETCCFAEKKKET